MTLGGAALNGFGFDPVRALYWAAVINGVLAAPLMAVMMLIARNKKAMGKLALTTGSTLLGWAATLVMAAASLLFFILIW
jgi:Mn2+/Fe2+ NRAMP family transporter